MEPVTLEHKEGTINFVFISVGRRGSLVQQFHEARHTGDASDLAGIISSMACSSNQRSNLEIRGDATLWESSPANVLNNYFSVGGCVFV
jgi:hypothetical protein